MAWERRSRTVTTLGTLWLPAVPGVCLPCQPQPAENIPYIEGEFPLRYLAVLALYPTEAGGMHKDPILKVPTPALSQFLSAKSLKSLSPRGSTQAWLPLSSLSGPSWTWRRKQKSNWHRWSKMQALVLLPSLLLLPPRSSQSIPDISPLHCHLHFKGHPANFLPSRHFFFLFRN